jgi:hypothetical protein
VKADSKSQTLVTGEPAGVHGAWPSGQRAPNWLRIDVATNSLQVSERSG